MAPITGTNLVQPLAQIGQSGATIVNLDSPVDPAAAEAAGVEIATFIASNNDTAGQLAGEEMGRLLAGTGKVAVLGGISGDANSNARTGGFTRAAEAAGLTVVQTVAADWDREKALNAAGDILRANPDLGGFYAANDTMALGAVQAGTERRKHHRRGDRHGRRPVRARLDQVRRPDRHRVPVPVCGRGDGGRGV